MKKYTNKRNRRIRFIAGGILLLIAGLFAWLSPELLGATGLMIAAVPIWGSIEKGTFKELTPEQIAEMEVKDLAEYYNDWNRWKEKELRDLVEKSKTDSTKEIQDAIKALKDEIVKENQEQMKSLQDVLVKQGIAIKQLLDGKGQSKRQSLEEYLTENKDALVGIARGKSGFEILTIKANTTRSSITNSAEQVNIAQIGQIPTRKLKFYDLFAKVPVGPGSGGVITYYDWDEATTVRSAKVIAEGGAYVESTAKWKWYSLNLVKVGDILPLSEEFEQDMPRFAAELELFLRTNVDIIVDDQLYDGDGTGNNMTGVYTKADTYTAAASGITDANVYDLIAKVKANITSGTKYEPNFVAMNIADILKFKLKKDANNNYVMPPFVSDNGSTIDGMLVIETSAVTANTMLVGDSRFATIYEVEGFTLERGYQSGDWELDMPSLKVRRRLNIVVKNADAGAFNKVTDIDAALVTLAS